MFVYNVNKILVHTSMCSSSENLSDNSYFVKDYFDMYIIYEHDLPF